MLREFGLQLCLKAHSKDVRTLEDVMVCFIHWRLLRYGFICMGEGPSPDNVPTEVLPVNMGWDGDLKGYFLKYQVKRRQYLLSVNFGTSGGSEEIEVGLLSDTRVTKVLVDITNVVWNDSQINVETAEDVAFRIDTDLIQAQGFLRIEEKRFDKEEERRKLLGVASIGINPDNRKINWIGKADPGCSSTAGKKTFQ